MATASVVAALALAACGSDSSSTSSSASTSSGSSTASDATTTAASPEVAKAKAAVAKYEQPIPTFPGPKSGPKAQKGKTVYLISCSQASSCAQETAASADAAKALGWTTRTIDTKGNPATFSSSIINAVNSGADGILLESIPANLVQDALRTAKDKKVPVIAVGDIVRDDDPLITASASVDWQAQGTMVGDFLVAESNGSAQVLFITDNAFPGPKQRTDVAQETLKKCTGCSTVETINMSIQDATGPRASQVISAALNRYGKKIQYIVTPYDAVDPFVYNALKQTGRTDVKIVGGVAGAAQSKLCHDGAVSATTVVALGWLGWAGADQLNRAFAGEPPAPDDTNIPTFLATPKTCPADGAAENAIQADWQGGYKAIWGV